MILHLNLTEDHLKLVRFLNIEDKDDDVLTINKKVMLTMQTHILDDVAMILGLRDKAIKNTEEDADGAAYPDEGKHARPASHLSGHLPPVLSAIPAAGRFDRSTG